MDLAEFVEQVSGFTSQDVFNGLKSVTFGGNGEPQPFPFRGTPNPYETDFSIAWNADGSLQSDRWWYQHTCQWMSVHYEVPLLLGLFYGIGVHLLQWIMKDRKPATWLDPLLTYWNLFLSVFSAVCCAIDVYLAYDFIVLQGRGMAADLCLSKRKSEVPIGFLFCLSKVPELIDTLFLCLKKKPVIFLHWYHHIVTMLYCWDAWVLQVNQGGYFATMNLFVHSFMYFYYFLMTRPWGFTVRIPSFVPLFITILQISQMFAGLTVMYFCFQHCRSTFLSSDFRIMLNFVSCILMYFSFLVLFVNFFVNRYLFGRSPTQSRRPVNPKDKPE